MTTESNKLIGLREYARLRGVSLSTVQKAIATGRISIIDFEGKKLLDPIMASEEWSRNTKPTLNNKIESKDESDLYYKSRAEKEKYLAFLAKLEYEKKTGEVLDKEDTKRTIIKVVTSVRDALLNIPDRIAPELVAISDHFTMVEKLRLEIHRTLEALSHIPEKVDSSSE